MKKLFLLLVSVFFFISLYAQNWIQTQKIVASDRGIDDHYGTSVSVSGDYAIVGAPNEGHDLNGGNTMGNSGSAYIYKKDSLGNWTLKQKIVASDRAAGPQFGISVSISDNYAIVGAFREGDDAMGVNNKQFAGAAYIFKKDTGGYWIEEQKIVSSDRTTMDLFGRTVAISGNYAIVGAIDENHDINGGNYVANAGSAYIFEMDSGGTWNEVQKIVALDREQWDYYSYSLSISGNYAIVGSWGDDHDSNGGSYISEAGSAYIYERDTVGHWNLVEKIITSDRTNYDSFGYSVSINSNYAIISSPQQALDANGGNPLGSAGAAYIFERDILGNWNEVQKIVASDRGATDRFGSSVSIDGNYTIIGAIRNDEDALGLNFIHWAGAAYIFEKDSIGSWNEVQKVVASDRNYSDELGYSVSISNDYAFVGAWEDFEDTAGINPLSEAGSVYIYNGCITTNTITQIACKNYLSPSGNHIWSSSGTYLDTVPSGIGCYILVTVNLTIITVDTSITKVTSLGGTTTLYSNQIGAKYQWLDCNNGYAVLVGDTNQAYSPNLVGIYAVEITANGCVDTSSCISVTLVGIMENDFGPSFNFYPNPTSGKITIDLGKHYKTIDVSVKNVLGQLVLSKTYKTTNQLSFRIKGSSGVYFVELRTDEGLPAGTLVKAGKSAVFKVVKE